MPRTADNALTRLEAAARDANEEGGSEHGYYAELGTFDAERILAVLRAAVEWLREGAPDDEFGPDIRLAAAVDALLSEGE